MSELRPFEVELGKRRPDGRTRAGRVQKLTRLMLSEQLGGEACLSAGQRLLIERAAVLQSRISEFDQKRTEAPLSEREEKAACELDNQFVRIIHRLGLDRPPAPEPAPDPVQALHDYLNRTHAPEEAA